MWQKGHGGHRLPWFDLLLGVALALLVFRAVVQVWPPFDRKEKRIVRLEVIVSGLAVDLAAQLAVGQWVKDDRSGEFMGKIIRKVTAAGGERADRAFGEFNRESFASRQDLLLVLERTGTIREREGIFFGREAVRSGQERKFHTFYVEFTGRINRMVVVKE
ncbi:MAG: hypothetical protein GX081_09355 [Firmicutes bacterium]|nr:hypothetical protein [Bacillota bacterium]